MTFLPRALELALRPASTRRAAPTGAPGELRRRVLGTVRGEAGDAERREHTAWESSFSFSRPAILTVSVITAATALAGMLVLGLSLGSSTAGPSSSARVPSRPRRANASLRRIGSHAELVVSNLPEPPVGEVYEVWLSRGAGAPQPTDALFMVTSAGSASVDVPGDLRGVRAVAVTAEPLGGSTSPTSPPVLRAVTAAGSR